MKISFLNTALKLKMNYILKPSLEHIAFVKVATTLWNQCDIRDAMLEFYSPSNSNQLKDSWSKIEDQVIKKVPNMPLPELLKEKLVCFIKSIGFQIFSWIRYLNICLNICMPELNVVLYFTPEGTINIKKTAEVIIKNEILDITKRYRLACIYCMEKDILELWNKMPENIRKSFIDELLTTYVNPACNKDQHELVVFWTYSIKGEMDSMKTRLNCNGSLNQFAFEYAARAANKVAAQYFWEKLTPKEKRKSLLKSTRSVAYEYWKHYYEQYQKEQYSDVLCFLLTQMDSQQQTNVFQSHHYYVLKCFLDWPRQNFYMETISHMWSFLPGGIYDCLLRSIIDKVSDGFKDFDYQKLFQENWLQSPNHLKRYILNANTNGYLLAKLFKIKDENNIKLIFQHADIVEKRKIIQSSGQNICTHLIHREEWGLLEIFIHECISTNDLEIIRFLENFEKFIRFWRSEDETKNVKYDKFLHLLKDSIIRMNTSS